MPQKYLDHSVKNTTDINYPDQEMYKLELNYGNLILDGYIKDFSLTNNTIMVLTNNGDVYGWGQNINGELGFLTEGSMTDTPQKIFNEKFERISTRGKSKKENYLPIW